MSTIRFSAHALARYGERVRPGLDADDLAIDLERLVRHATLTDVPPAWLMPGANEPAALYLTLDDITFPLRPGDGVQIAITCLTRGGLPTLARVDRNRRRRARQRRRAAGRRPLAGMR